MASTHDHGNGHGHDNGHDHGHDDHHELGWWRTYVFSTDHKTIGIQYGLTGLVFLFFGFLLMLVMRWQLANPGIPVPRIGGLLQAIFGSSAFESTPEGIPGVLTQTGYNSFGAMHGTIMVFFGIVPIAFAAFGNFVVPLQIGAPDMTFPRINMASYWCFFISCVPSCSGAFSCRVARRSRGGRPILRLRACRIRPSIRSSMGRRSGSSA